jgi:hypothetical protein
MAKFMGRAQPIRRHDRGTAPPGAWAGRPRSRTRGHVVSLTCRDVVERNAGEGVSKPAPSAEVTITPRPAGQKGASAQVPGPHLADMTRSPAPAFAGEHYDLAGRGAPAGGRPPWDSRSAGTGMGSGPAWLSFQRIVDVPFEACVGALESWQRRGCGDGLQAGRSRLRGPAEHDRDSGTCQVEVLLARGPLRPLLRMRLDVDCWSSSCTALELIPCGRVRATSSYFRAGHLLLDSLTHSLQLERETRRLTETR